MGDGKRLVVLMCAEDSDYVKKMYGGYYGVFVEMMAEEGEAWNVFMVVNGEFPDDEQIDNLDGFVITGSCNDAHDNDAWICRLISLLKILDSLNKKVLGICFGHQQQQQHSKMRAKELRMVSTMVKRARELFVFLFLAMFSKAISMKPYWRTRPIADKGSNGCLTWQLAVETNNVRGWRIVPFHCLRHIETYMTDGQYDQDINYIVEQIESYVTELVVFEDGMDAWILDVDYTCLSNIFYYKRKKYGCEPYDPWGFKAWITRAECPAIPAVLGLFTNLVDAGFKVFLITGRDEDTLASSTVANLHSQRFIGYERVIFSPSSNRFLRRNSHYFFL